jgi:alpha-L-rhamnosidase
VFAPSACFLHDVGGFLSSWLADLAADQTDDGVVPIVIPNLWSRIDSPAAAMFHSAQAVWGDAAVVVPWVLYQRYGETAILARQYDSMRRWIDCIEQLAGADRLWNRGFQLADWLDPNAPPDEPARAITDPHLVATAYFAHVTRLLSETARVLGFDEDRERYARLSDEVRAAFRREWVTPNGRLASDSQTAYALALLFGLIEDPAQRTRAARRLASLVRFNRYRVGTGFAGTAVILDALVEAGELDTAYRMAMERECPSWLYPVTMGATTIWERWDSQLSDGRVNPGEMTSFNHYALGAVVDWLHRTVAGLAPLEPGYRRIEVRPRPGGGITRASARLRTPYGLAESAWRLDDGTLRLRAVIPPNTTARVMPPDGIDPIEVGSGAHEWTFAAR